MYDELFRQQQALLAHLHSQLEHGPYPGEVRIEIQGTSIRTHGPNGVFYDVTEGNLRKLNYRTQEMMVLGRLQSLAAPNA